MYICLGVVSSKYLIPSIHTLLRIPDTLYSYYLLCYVTIYLAESKQWDKTQSNIAFTPSAPIGPVLGTVKG